MIYVGIDVHKKVCVACLQDEKGQVIREMKFENKEIGFQLLLESLKGKDVKAVMESTANLWRRLYRKLDRTGSLHPSIGGDLLSRSNHQEGNSSGEVGTSPGGSGSCQI